MKNIPFKNKPRKCPRCGSTQIASILYGYPAFDEKLEKKLEEGRIVLGGCMEEEGAPTWQCVDCGQEFERKVELLEEIEDYHV